MRIGECVASLKPFSNCLSHLPADFVCAREFRLHWSNRLFLLSAAIQKCRRKCSS